MPRLGHSGSTILVTDEWAAKHGRGAADQADYVMELGGVICPYVLSVSYDSDNYKMERLQELVLGEVDFRMLLLHMTGVLERHAWSRPVYCEDNWIPTLAKWAEDFGCLPQFEEAILELYVTPVVPLSYRRIHGDPTFANVMTRGDDKRVVLIDPIRPVGKIPPLREVDIGKIIQSLLGWEHQLDERWPEAQVPLVSYLLKDASQLTQKRSWFWAAVHCARILPYAHSDHVVEWCETNAKRSLSLAIRL